MQAVKELELEVGRKEEAIERERESRKRLNEMLQGYKDEVSGVMVLRVSRIPDPKPNPNPNEEEAQRDASGLQG